MLSQNNGASYATEDHEVRRDTSVRRLLAPLKEWLDDPQITEIAVSRPCEVWCERGDVWESHSGPDLTYQNLLSLATATARFSNRNISDSQPLLSATLPEGERMQIVIPPACEQGTISITIRKPSFIQRSLDDYERDGFFKHILPASEVLTAGEKELQKLKEEKNYLEFIRRAVHLGKVIVVAGETGSGKTTLMKSLMQEIPQTQRIITIEDVPELFLPKHKNRVHLYYSSEAKEEENAVVTAASLLRSSLRMKPSRIILAELRGAETFDFINVCASGHAGSITSLHASSCELAFERLALMILQNRQGRALPYQVIRHLLYTVVDVVIHVHNDLGRAGRHITDFWYEPSFKYARLKKDGSY